MHRKKPSPNKFPHREEEMFSKKLRCFRKKAQFLNMCFPYKRSGLRPLGYLRNSHLPELRLVSLDQELQAVTIISICSFKLSTSFCETQPEVESAARVIPKKKIFSVFIRKLSPILQRGLQPESGQWILKERVTRIIDQ
ncbi:hypothetical protein CH376_04190 [Leptospira adleri]|nr:hypothetical protein CH376_04190 [Leptospira adleri]